jgi:hypothetical protein
MVAMENFLEIINSLFKTIIDKYHFDIIPVDDYKNFLIGNGFALAIVISREGATIYYIVPNEQGNFFEYWFDNFICSKFDAEDRTNYGKPLDYSERVVAELKVMASGLYRHWDSMLKGDKGWIEEYKKYEFGGEPRKADEFDTKLLKMLVNQQP